MTSSSKESASSDDATSYRGVSGCRIVRIAVRGGGCRITELSDAAPLPRTRHETAVDGLRTKRFCGYEYSFQVSNSTGKYTTCFQRNNVICTFSRPAITQYSSTAGCSSLWRMGQPVTPTLRPSDPPAGIPPHQSRCDARAARQLSISKVDS